MPPSVIGSICPSEDGLAGIMTGVCGDRPARRCDVLVRPDQAATAVCKAEYLMRWGGQCSARCTPQRPAAAGERLSQYDGRKSVKPPVTGATPELAVQPFHMTRLALAVVLASLAVFFIAAGPLSSVELGRGALVVFDAFSIFKRKRSRVLERDFTPTERFRSADLPKES
jgi:hypothetical protein